MTSTTPIWARVDAGVVHELTTLDPSGRFVPSLQWVNATGAPGVAVGWHWDGTSLSPPPVIQTTVTQARAALAACRYEHETSGIMFQPEAAKSAVLIATDRVSQAKIAAAAMAAAGGHWTADTPWKLADGQFVPLTAADVQALAASVSVHVAACYAHEAALSSMLDENPSADISQGWPAGS